MEGLSLGSGYSGVAMLGAAAKWQPHGCQALCRERCLRQKKYVNDSGSSMIFRIV